MDNELGAFDGLVIKNAPPSESPLIFSTTSFPLQETAEIS